MTRRILIDGLPRCGTTTMARLLALHPEARMIIEPFHPRRYGGEYQSRALAGKTGSAFDFVWRRWNVVKHVWETPRIWPFHQRPELQAELWRSAETVIAMERRNLVRRYVSAELSRVLRLWIGTRDEFESRLRTVCILPFDVGAALRSMRHDYEAMKWRKSVLRDCGVTVLPIIYEDFYALSLSDQISVLRNCFQVAGMPDVRPELLMEQSATWLDPAVYRWSSLDSYCAIPNWQALDTAAKREGFGSLLDDSVL
jgi:hypothetical protein